MGEICILHAPETWEFARHVAAALAAEGHSVFRRETTDAHQPAADAVIVIWSPAMLSASALVDAARRALARRILVPVSVGGVEPPSSFSHVWPIDLSGWEGDRNDPRWQFVRDEIDLAVRRHETVSEPFPAEERMAWTSRTLAGADGPARLVAPVVAGLVALVAGALVLAPWKERLPSSLDHPSVAMVEPERSADEERLSRAEMAATRPEREAPAETPPRPAAGERLAEAETEARVPPAPADIPSTDDKPIAVPMETAALRPAVRETEPAARASAAPADSEPAAGEADVEELAEGDQDPPAETQEDEASAGAAPAAAETQLASAAPPLPQPAPDDFTGIVFRDCANCPDMAEIPGGGVATADPANGVLLVGASAPGRFALSRREITFEEWNACVAAGACRPVGDAQWGGGKRPVINVSYDDAQAFVQWLSQQTGRQYRLPTEAEWEYAARAGHAGSYSFGDPSPDRANYAADGVSRNMTTPAGSFAPSVYGLYDMHGNVWEWAADCATDDCTRHVIKGGAWNTPAASLAAEERESRPIGAKGPDIGFRVARDLP